MSWVVLRHPDGQIHVEIRYDKFPIQQKIEVITPTARAALIEINKIMGTLEELEHHLKLAIVARKEQDV